MLEDELTRRQPILLYASHGDFEHANAISGVPGESTGGVTEVLKLRIVLPLAGPLAESDHVLGHEIAHAFQLDILHQPGRDLAQIASLPGWLIEALAEYLSLGPIGVEPRMWLRDAVARDAVPDVRELASGRYFPYRYRHAFWMFLAHERGDRVIGVLLREIVGGKGASDRGHALPGPLVP